LQLLAAWTCASGRRGAFELVGPPRSIFKPAGGGKYAPIARVPTEQWPTAKK
jgi:hypothetical protein